MGSYGLHRDKGVSNADFFADELLNAGERIIAHSTVRSVFYAAVQRGDEVFALVVPFHWNRGSYENFTYKPQDETVGPYDCAAPAKVLDALTPTDDEYANRWREQCRKNLAKKAAASKIEPGSIVRFVQALDFGSRWGRATTFAFEKRSTFRALDATSGTRFQCSIPNWRSQSFEVVDSVQQTV